MQGEVGPIGMEVDGENGDAVLHDAGKADRNAIETRQELVQSIEFTQDGFGSGHGGGNNALALAEGIAGWVEQHRLEAGAADVNRERDRAGRNGGAGHENFEGHQRNCSVWGWGCEGRVEGPTGR